MPEINYSKLSIAEVKELLIEAGYAAEDLEGRRKAELVEVLENDNKSSDIPSLDEAELDEDETIQQGKEELVNTAPVFGSQEWQDHVLSLFTDKDKWIHEERDDRGNVRKIETYYAKSLARVGRLIYGCPMSDGPVHEELSFNGPKNLPVAFVRYEVVVSTPTGARIFRALADTSWLNTEDKFLAFPLASAETKAMGRAWTKALGINVYAKEEFTSKDTAKAVEETSADWSGDEEITGPQKKTIINMCSKLRIVVNNLLNMNSKYEYDGKIERYDGLDDPRLTKKKGVGLIEVLNKMQQNSIPVHESLKTVVTN